jgi:aspartyl-tRNA synthetase
MEAAGPLAKNIGPERTEAIRQQLASARATPPSSSAASPRPSRRWRGRARNVIGEELGLTDKDRFAFAWIVDFPMYEDRRGPAGSTSATTRSRCRRAGSRR